MKPIIALGVGLLAVFGLAAESCDSANEEFNDAPKLANLDTPALRISMPDGFGNAAAKCVGTDLLYSGMNNNGRTLAVSPNHPWCEDWLLTKEDMER